MYFRVSGPFSRTALAEQLAPAGLRSQRAVFREERLDKCRVANTSGCTKIPRHDTMACEEIGSLPMAPEKRHDEWGAACTVSLSLYACAHCDQAVC